MIPEEFNSIYSIGTSVNYHPIIGQPEHIKTITRSEAYSLPNKEPVIMVVGKAGCVSLDAISIDPEVEKYVRLGRIAESHKIDCLCGDCQEFLIQGDKVHAMGLQA
jgi:hypothetical protein